MFIHIEWFMMTEPFLNLARSFKSGLLLEIPKSMCWLLVLCFEFVMVVISLWIPAHLYIL